MSNQIEKLSKVCDDLKEKGFADQEINVQAKKDFTYLALQTGYSPLTNQNYQKLITADKDTRYVGDYLIVGYNVEDKKALFPKALIDVNDPNVNVAVVCYKNGSVQDVLVFGAQNFKKAGLFSMFKDLKDMYGIVIKNFDKLKQYSFGYVIKNK